MRGAHRLIGTILGTVLVSGPALAQDAAAPDEQITLDYENYTLDNGLEVILVEDHSAPVVAVDLWYHVGGANDPEGRSGFAHLFEHTMFQGTANLDKDALLRLVDDAGGDYNAYTAIDRTAYHETLPAHQLPLGLWLEADRMASLAITQTNLDNQRAVVIQEYEQNYGGAPYGLALRDLTTLTYSYAPYRRSPIGSVEDLNQATVAEITDFHATYYVPNNATLVVAGDFDPATARALIEMYFAPIPAGDEPPELPAYQPQQQAAAFEETLEDDLVRIPATLVGYETPPPADEDTPALRVLATLLSVGDASRFTRELVDTGEALAADAILEQNYGPGLFGFILLPGSLSRDALETRVFDAIADIAANGVPQAELDRAIALLRSQQLTALETAFGIAEEVQTGNAFFDDPAAIVTEFERVAAVTSEDIRHVADEYLAPEDRHVFRVDPGPPQPFVEPTPFVGATGTPADDEFEVAFALPYTMAPDPLPVTVLDLPPMTERTLSNGLDVVVIEMPELPVISLDLLFRGGVRLVGDEDPALAAITAELLTRGTETRTADEIADELEGRGGVTSGYSTDDLIGLGLFALIEDRDLAFELLSDMALHPVFPEDDLAVQVAQWRSSLEAALGDPGAQASRAYYPRVYGGHPYGAIVTDAGVSGIERDDVAAYYDSVRNPANALLVIAGRIETDAAIAMAEAAFGGWQAEGAPPEFPKAELAPAAPSTVLVNVPGAEQATLVIGNLAVRGDAPERYPLSVANAVLGEGLSSRLNRLLREELGYSYGVGSGLTLPAGTGTFMVSSNVQAVAVADAVQQIIDQVQRLRTEPIPESELAPVRDGMVGRFALSLETYQDFVESVASYWVRGLPIDEIGDYPERIAAVTPDTAHAAAEAGLPADLVTVVAGDAAVLGPLLEANGPVTVVEAQ